MLRNAVVAALALVLPTLLVGADSAAIVLVASLAALVVAMTHLAAGFELAPALVAVRVRTDEASGRTMPGRVTDPVHHPIRRRAPGQV